VAIREVDAGRCGTDIDDKILESKAACRAGEVSRWRWLSQLAAARRAMHRRMPARTFVSSLQRKSVRCVNLCVRVPVEVSGTLLLPGEPVFTDRDAALVR
jgi:hypothetical protein